MSLIPDRTEQPVKLCSICGKAAAAKYSLTCSDCGARQIALEKAEKIIKQQVPARYLDASLDKLSSSLRHELLSLDVGEGVVLLGSVGSGKTFAMIALQKHYIQNGFTTHRTQFEALRLRIQDTYRSDSEISEYQIIQELATVDKLFLEDIGTSSKDESEFSMRTIRLLLDIRTENLLPTFFTTNRDIRSLDSIFECRIMSRMKGYCKILSVVSNDRRLK